MRLDGTATCRSHVRPPFVQISCLLNTCYACLAPPGRGHGGVAPLIWSTIEPLH